MIQRKTPHLQHQSESPGFPLDFHKISTFYPVIWPDGGSKVRRRAELQR